MSIVLHFGWNCEDTAVSELPYRSLSSALNYIGTIFIKFFGSKKAHSFQYRKDSVSMDRFTCLYLNQQQKG